jgi:hypothetical protein
MTLSNTLMLYRVILKNTLLVQRVILNNNYYTE